ncbi:MAG: glycosyltransferase family 4 protein [Planctomycetota bacterium]|jgi:glycosyltransferase involved in cell wall biosynthesis
MHVGLILEHSDPRRGGAERYAADLSERLRVHGHKVTVCARTGPAARPPVPRRPVSWRPFFYARRFLPFLREQGAERVMSLVPAPGCDIFQPRNGIVSASIPPHLEPVPEPMRTLRRLNPVRRWQLFLLDRFEARTVAPPCRFLAASPLVKRHFQARYPALPAPPVLRAGVDLERFAPGPPERDVFGLPGGPLLLFVAHSFEYKGLRTALRALARLPGATLCVAGEGRAAALQRLAARLGVADRVSWRGHEPGLAALYRACDLLVHPTYYDTAARVVLEALASGIPAVTTERDGNADLARAGGGEVLEDPGDAAALAGAVERLLAVDRGTRAARARATAEEHSKESWLDRTVEAITCGFSS